MLSCDTMQTKILSWFSVLESTNNVKFAGDGEFIQVSACTKIMNIERGLTELFRK